MYTHTRISALTLRTSKFHANVNSILLFSWTLILYTLNIRPICLKVNDFASFFLKTDKLQARNRQMQYDKNSANRFAKNDKRKINTLAGDTDHSWQIDFCVCVWQITAQNMDINQHQLHPWWIPYLLVLVVTCGDVIWERKSLSWAVLLLLWNESFSLWSVVPYWNNCFAQLSCINKRDPLFWSLWPM